MAASIQVPAILEMPPSRRLSPSTCVHWRVALLSTRRARSRSTPALRGQVVPLAGWLALSRQERAARTARASHTT
eukprot:3820411-Prymnesium_polylepis.1